MFVSFKDHALLTPKNPRQKCRGFFGDVLIKAIVINLYNI